MHRFVNFKGFADAEVNLGEPVTLLIGKNGAGKTNCIEGVELLAEIARGRPLYEISDVGRGGGFEVRGGLAGCVRTGSATFRLEFAGNVEIEPKNEKKEFTYVVEIRAKPEPRIASESLEWGDRMLFETVEGSSELTSGVLKVRYDNFKRARTNRSRRFLQIARFFRNTAHSIRPTNSRMLPPLPL
jgi:ABC-type branched-subunit amino acid transport system ATPase component